MIMPLVVATLESGLEAVFLALPATGAQAAQMMADAYFAYASLGLFGASVPAFPTGSSLLVAPLAAAMIPIGTPAGFGAAWTAALSAFWIPAITVSGAQTGAVVGCAGAAAAAAGIAAVVANPLNTPGSAAAGIASVLDTATKTVSAALAPPPTPVLLL